MKDIKAGVKIKGKDESKGAFSSFAHSINAADLKTKQFNISLGTVAKGVGIAGGIVVGAAAAIGGAVIGVGAALVTMTRTTATYLDEIGKFSRQTGFSTEALQEFDFVARRNGLSVEKAHMGMVRFNKVFGELKTTTSAAAREIGKVDPVLSRQMKGAKSVSAAYEIYWKRLSEMEDPIKRNALAFAVFGKTGQQMLRIIDGGPDAFKALRQEAYKYGVVTAEEAKKAEAFIDAQENMNTAMTGLKNAVSLGLMPALTESMQGLADFFAEMRPEIVKTSSGLIKSMGELLTGAIKYLVENPDALKNFFGDAVGSLKSVVDELKNVKELVEDGKTWWRDVKGFVSGGPDRRDKALAASGSGIIYGTENAGRIVDPERIKSAALLNSIEGTGPLGMLNPAAVIAGISDAVAAGMAAQRQNLDITMRYVGGKDAWRAQVSSQGGGVTVSEAPKNYFDPGAFE